MALTRKQSLFVAEYLVDLNGKQAAIRAGYSERRAEVTASELLASRKVSEAVAVAQKKRAERVEFTADDVLRHWVEIAMADPNDLIQYRRGACPECWSDDEAERTDEADPKCKACRGEGKGRVYVADSRHLKGSAKRLYAGVKLGKEGLQVLMRDQDAAVLNIAKHLGMFVERKQITGPDGGPVQQITMTSTEFQEIARGIAGEI